MAKTSCIISEIIKSPRDKREYRGLVLPNNMKVLLVSDPETDQSAASLTVAVGSMNDPIELPGLAHFLEHMLFMGTEKYPEENDYNKFIAENGGSYNAFTARDETTFHFTVSPSPGALKGALDRFSQFFISPLFTESATEREVNAVNAEHEMNIQVDSYRIAKVMVGTSKPHHPYSQFSCGNRKTLWTRPKEKNIDVRSALLEFYDKHYSANLMSLAVLGSETLDDLQELVESLFSEVVDKNVPATVWSEPPYGLEELQTIIEIVPVMDIRQVSLMFPVPDLSKYYKSNSAGYLSHLVGHEGEGSLLSLLKEKNWANELCSGYSLEARGVALFEISVEPTQDGLNNRNALIQHIFEYLQMLRTVGPQKWIWDERRELNAMSFRFLDNEHPQSVVTEASSAMNNYPMTDILSLGFILTDFKPDLITEILDCLVPEKCCVTVSSKEFSGKTNLVEEWYGAEYNLKKIDKNDLNAWKNCGTNEKLRLPSKNEFIPNVFDLKPRDEYCGTVPRIVEENSMSRIWFLQDNEFNMPKAIVKVVISSPVPMLGPLQTLLNTVFVSMVEDSLTEYSYAAGIAGLAYSICDTMYGIEIDVSGYDHKLGLLLYRVMEKIVNFSIDPQRFEASKDSLMRGLKNVDDEPPDSRASEYMYNILVEPCWTREDYLGSMKDVIIDELKEFAKKLVSTVYFEWVVYGNVRETEALEMVHKCQDLFKRCGTTALSASEINKSRKINLPEGINHLFQSEHKTHPSSCVAILFQVGLQNTRQNVLVDLLGHIADEPFFDQLRTKEQLGYGISIGVRSDSVTQGIQFFVQSDRHPAYLEERIDNFLINLEEILNKMTEEEFLQHRQAVFVKNSVKPKTLYERADIICAQIYSQQYNFNSQATELAELETVTLNDVRHFFDMVMGPKSEKKKRLSIHVVSVAEGGAGCKEKEIFLPKSNQVIIKDIVEWKRRQALYPACLPYVSLPARTN